MITILNLETSALACTVSIGQNGKLLTTKASDGEMKHSKEITLLIQSCLDETKLSFDDIHAVAISKGPGSYTGLRVGASAAKGICYGKDIKLIAVDTLKTIAYPFLTEIPKDGFIIPLIDARRDEVYYNIYDDQLNAQIDTINLILDDQSFKDYANKSVIICGDGAQKAEKLVQKPNFKYTPSKSLAQNMVSLSYEKYTAQDFEDIAYFSPFYLKAPNITKSKKKLF